MRFENKPGRGAIHGWMDRFFIEPAIRRGIRTPCETCKGISRTGHE